MAGLKKKKKDKSGSPNVVLVVFLVFFILVTIGLGIWGYSQIADVAEARKAKDAAGKLAMAAKVAEDFNDMLQREYFSALGGTLDAEDEKQLIFWREEFAKPDGGTFKEMKRRDQAKAFLDDLRKQVGADPSKDANYKKKLKDAQDTVTDLQGKLANAIAKNERFETFTAKVIAQRDQFQQKISGDITKGNAASLAANSQKSDEFKKQTEQYLALQAELKSKQEEMDKLAEDHAAVVKARDRQLAQLMKEYKDLAVAAGAGGGNLGGGRAGAEPFPLVLDLSTGAPLWDAPVGKVVRVDLDARQVTINLGSAHGVTPELTFNIFGADSSGRPVKHMKGSVEVIKVIDTATSLARITSLYDAEGREILMNLQTRGRLLRESEAAIREGDLLFNLYWGTRVAVAGYVSITGEASNNPAEQYRQMEDFMHLLRRNGMQVDAYVDLRDGQIKGRITPSTRYLIRGDDLLDATRKKGEEEAGGNEQPGADRTTAVNKASLALRKDAIDRGLLLISADNFATVIGYRKARNANSFATSPFRPALPYAGKAQSGVLVLPNRQEEEKKAPDPQN